MKDPSSPSASVVAIWGSVIAGSLIVALQASQQIPTFLTVAVARPISVAVGVIGAVLVASVVLRRPFGGIWTEMMRFLPFAAGFGIVVSWLGIWNDGSGAIPTSAKDGLLFVATAGAFPVAIGPDAFVRTFVLTSVVAIAVKGFRSGASWGRAVVAGVSAWVAASLALLVQTWMALGSSIVRDLPLVHAEDAMRALGASHMDAYWSTFQADRFFAGVGKQLETSVLLSSSALLFLVGVVLVGIVAVRSASPTDRDFRRLLIRKTFGADAYASLYLLSAAVCGVIVGSMAQRRVWTALDVVPLIVFGTVTAAWILRFLLGREADRMSSAGEGSDPGRLAAAESIRPARDILTAVVMVGALLLGWPVLVAAVALTALGEAASAWMRSPLGRGATYGIFAAFAVASGGLVASRSMRFPFQLDRFDLAWAMVAASVPTLALAHVIASHAPSGWRRALPFGVVGLVGVAAAAILRLPVALAPLALLLLVLYRFRHRVEIWR
ncbi:hypothetical protein L0Y59_05185, partial [Candidatus Uhrbacteria bacterium]|nr:hypothetical protein [Candidatus Uhrbacteria bacterium]